MKKTIDVLTIGEALVDMISLQKGVSVQDATGFTKAFGGALANVAVGCARLGAKAAFIGKVGDDPFGRYLVNTMEEAGVVTKGVVFSKEHETSLVFVSLDQSGKPAFHFYGRPSADLNLKPDELDLKIVNSAKYFHFGTVSLSDEPSRSATQEAVKAAKKAGAIVSYDPNVRFHMWESRDEAIEWAMKMTPEADILKISDDEAEWLFGTRDPLTAIRQILWLGTKLVVVTMGAQGVYFSNRVFSGRLPAFPVNVVDTTGAGDAFVAGMLTSLAASEVENPLTDFDTVRNAMVRASAAAALTTEAVGAISAMPDKDTLDRALKDRFGVDDM